MSIGILLVTHNQIGQVLLETALVNLGRENPGVQSVAVPFESDPDLILAQCQHITLEINTGSGVLILTDLFGSTPSNIAHKLTTIKDTCVISGLNLPMLMKVIDYSEDSLDTIASKALKGGKDGILIANPTSN